jgi:hypothetical protein
VYYSQNNIRMTEPKRMRWARPIECMGVMNAYKGLVGKAEHYLG